MITDEFPFDILVFNRLWDYNGDLNTVPDMGAYEIDCLCPAHQTVDGEFSLFDVNAHSAMNLIADFKGDGSFNFFDVSAFLNAYS